MADPDLAAVNRKLNWLSVAVVLLLAIEVVRTLGGFISGRAGGIFFVVVFGTVLVVLALLFTAVTAERG